MKKSICAIIASVTFGLVATGPGIAAVSAGVTTAAVREAVEYVSKKFGKEVASEGVEAVVRKAEKIGAAYGDEGLEALRKVGPQAAKIADDAGIRGAEAVRIMSRYGEKGVWVAGKSERLALVTQYGDDAAEALLKQGEIAEPLIKEFGPNAAKALKTVSEQNGRRLAMMTSDADLQKVMFKTEVLDVVGKYGDRAADFVWRNKGSLAVGTALAAFLANPEPFLDGTRDIAEIAAKSIVLPVALDISESVNWTAFFVTFAGGLTAFWMWRSYQRRRSESKSSPSAR